MVNIIAALSNVHRLEWRQWKKASVMAVTGACLAARLPRRWAELLLRRLAALLEEHLHAGWNRRPAGLAKLSSDDEQYIHSERLRRYRPITLVPDRRDLGAALDAAALGRRTAPVPSTSGAGLDFGGIETIRRRIFADLL